MADRTFGLRIEVTEKGLAVFDQAGNKVETLGKKAAAAGPQLDKLGKSGEAVGPLIRRSADVATAGLIQLVPAAEKATGALGALTTVTGGLGAKALEEGLEGGVKMLTSTGEAAAKAKTEMLAFATSPLVGVAAVAVLGNEVRKLITVWSELQQVEADALAARERSQSSTGRAAEQYKQLAAALGITTAELNQLTTGSGAKGWAAMLEIANQNPGGRIAEGIRRIGQESIAAKDALAAANFSGPPRAAMVELSESAAKAEDAFHAIENRLQTLPDDLEAVAQRTGSSAKAQAILKDEIVRTVAAAQKYGIEVPAALAAVAAPQESAIDRQRRYNDELMATRENSARVAAANKAMADEVVANTKRMLEEQDKLLNQYRDIKIETDISQEGDTRVDTSSAAVQTAIADLRSMIGSLGPNDASRAQLEAALKQLQDGNVTGYQRIVDGLRANEKYIGDAVISGTKASVDKLGAMLTRLDQIGASLGGAPARASGGDVQAGRAYRVGERGPELFVPRESGTIVPSGGGFSSRRTEALLEEMVSHMRKANFGGKAEVEVRLAPGAERMFATSVKGSLERGEVGR